MDEAAKFTDQTPGAPEKDAAISENTAFVSL